ncbi:MAG: hypothetical protein ABR507_00890 [Actinomycetota bacterium]|nr:hypothetical protein [Actinomycetota bacterium]
MTFLLVFVLALLWGAVFLPALLRAKQQTSPLVTIGRFRRGMRALGSNPLSGGGGRWIVVPEAGQPADARNEDSRNRMVALKRRLFIFLLATSAVTAVFALLSGSIAIGLNIVADLLLAGYVVFLVRTRTPTAPQKGAGYDNADLVTDDYGTEQEEFLHAGSSW